MNAAGMVDLTSPAALRALLRQFGHAPRYSLGQNFLVHRPTLDRIVAAAELGPGDTVIEIGPGVGTLTRELAARAGRVLAVELDRSLFPLLEASLAGLPVQLEHGDAAQLDWLPWLRERGLLPPRLKVVANLPYYVTTPVITHLLEAEAPFERAVFMVQREVAERMAAPPGSKTYGALSVLVQYWTVPELVTRVPPHAFFPPPQVESAVVRLMRRQQPAVEAPRRAFFRVVRAAFGQRRKTLENALSAGLALPKEAVAAALHRAGVEPRTRGEQLSLAQFAQVAVELDQALNQLGARSPEGEMG